MVFDPHPAEALRPGSEPGRLSTFAQRERWLKGLGVESIVRLDPRVPIEGGSGKRVLELAPGEFTDWARSAHGVCGYAEGADFRYGIGRTGTVETLGAAADALGGGLRVVAVVDATLDDGSRVPARSGTVRAMLEAGRVADAAAVLGRPYEIDGRVVRGDQRGRTIGFPTANVRSELLLPADGVYAGTVHLPGGESVPAAISVGVKPTFEGGHARTLEAHLIGIGGPGQRVAEQEYDWAIRIEIEHWVRAQVRFSGIGELIEAIRRDCQHVVQLVSKGPAHAGSSKA